MGELEEFSESLIAQLEIELNAGKIVEELFEAVSKKDTRKISSLIEQDAAKYFVYSTYAIQYLSKISTTYGDYLDDVIYLNKFVLSSYPQIILYRQGKPYEPKFESIKSGYVGALKMTILEEMIHSIQENLQEMNKNAARS